ncbi:MAG: hypothetical protein EOO12_09515 [Chitinophagaceae bacterium]|nr:MAG: hypothetical protein EOO12_09515 [Chitinophagaceae bacterium]
MTRRVSPLVPAVVSGLPLFFVGHGFAQYFRFVPALSAAGLLLKYELAAALLWALFSWRLGAIRGALAAAATLAFYFFFGAFRDALGSTFLSRYSLQLPLWLGAWLLLLWWLRRRGGRSGLRYLALLLGVLLLVDAVSIARQALRKPELAPTPTRTAGDRPDVYFLLLDGYAGLDQLQADFGFDNGPFLDSLRSLGFKVQPHSRSNYEDTPFSMASLFQMDYLGLNRYNYTDAHLNYCYERIYDNPVLRRFRGAGYRVFNHSIFDLKGAPAPIENTLLVSGASLISSGTLGARLYRDLYANLLMTRFPQSAANRHFQLRALELNEDIARRTLDVAAQRSAEPRFVYTHFEMPHAPYYYKADGTLNPLNTMPGSLDRKDLYLGYLQYCNRYMLQFIRTLQARSARPPVILLLSDHGFRYVPDYRYHHSTLAAVSIPGSNYAGYTDSVSHVNQFPLLFHHLFGDSLALKPHRSY